jgi:gluconate 2-dehydrogenase gamma chain
MAGQDIQRREILRVMAMAAAAATFPGFTKWAFAGSHPPAGALQIKPASYKLQFFSPEEYALVERLTDLIIPSDETPGAREAGVAEFVDHMIAHDHDQQYKYRTGLTWMNAHSERALGQPFLKLSQEQQISLLEPLAYKAKYRPGEEDGREFFHAIRELTAMGFYSSEIGYKELDNPALKFYADSPACPHTDDREHKHLPPAKW